MALIFNQLPLVIITQSYLVKKVDAILDDLEWTMLMLVLTQPAHRGGTLAFGCWEFLSKIARYGDFWLGYDFLQIWSPYTKIWMYFSFSASSWITNEEEIPIKPHKTSHFDWFSSNYLRHFLGKFQPNFQLPFPIQSHIIQISGCGFFIIKWLNLKFGTVRSWGEAFIWPPEVVPWQSFCRQKHVHSKLTGAERAEKVENKSVKAMKRQQNFVKRTSICKSKITESDNNESNT